MRRTTADGRWALGGFGARKRTYYRTGFAIALISLSRLAIAVAIHSFDRTLQTVLFKQVLGVQLRKC